MKRTRAYISGVYLKAQAAFFTAGGATALLAAVDDWQSSGRMSSAALRGVVGGFVTGSVTAAAVAAVPNNWAAPESPHPSPVELDRTIAAPVILPGRVSEPKEAQ